MKGGKRKKLPGLPAGEFLKKGALPPPMYFEGLILGRFGLSSIYL